MKEALKRAVGGILAARDRYRKLSRLERLSVLLLGGLVASAVLLSLVPWGGSGYRVVFSSEGSPGQGGGSTGQDGGNTGASRLQRVVSLLAEGSVPWRERRIPGGARAIEVPEGAEHERALRILERESIPVSVLAGIDWPEKSSIFEPPERFEARLREMNRRKIENAILWNDKVRTATLVASSPSTKAFASRADPGESASVSLSLKPGAAALTRGEADAIRDMVRCAFNLRPERIAITDNLGNRYEAALAGSAPVWVEEKEERSRKLIQEVIERHYYSKAFAPEELSVAVLVALSPQRSTVEKREADREKTFSLEVSSALERGGELVSGGVMSPSDRPVAVRESVQSVPFESYEKTTIDIPAGELKGASVTVHVALAAVERVEAARGAEAASGAAVLPAGDREALVEAFEKREEEELRSFLSVLGNVKASVVVHPFVRQASEAPALAAGTDAPGEPGAAAAGSAASSTTWW
ncbi:MAG: hypothetical protein HY721_09155, partial [Planctomycetes bacterium]|nr:hypothetical protein [Planctomycetota bacterium]